MSKTILCHSKVLDEIHKVREKISKELEGKSPEEATRFWNEGANPHFVSKHDYNLFHHPHSIKSTAGQP